MLKKTMKKIYILLLNVFISLPLFAQITITSADMPGANDTIRYTNVDPLSIDVNTTGPNYNWVFDTIKANSQGVYNYMNALQTPYAFYFLGLNKYGLKTADSIGVGAFSFKEVYSFYKKSASKFEAEGTGLKYQGIPLAAYYGDNDEIYTFPLNYMDRDSTTYDYSIQINGLMEYTQKGYRINEVDGWGTIKTPFGTATCLRVVSSLFSKDSISINGVGFSFPNNSRTYKWLTNTEKIPYLEVGGNVLVNNFVPTSARYRGVDLLHVGISEPAVHQVTQLQPNPACDHFTISSSQVINRVVLYNELMQEVSVKEHIGTKSTSLSVSDLENGIYYVKADNGVFQKLIVLH
jgi:hypothetical protein